MTSDELIYLISGLFVFVVLGSFYLVFKNGFELEKMKSKVLFFERKTKEEERKEWVGEFIVGGVFIMFLLLLNEWAT